MRVSLEIGGFTPVFDCVALYVGQNGKKLGVVTAIVFGAAWRYCQMAKGVCNASIETIAERAGVSPKTAQRHIKVLCEEGFLKDLTPDIRNRPHEYADTGKAKMEGNLDAKTGRSESPTYETGRSESPTYENGRSESLTYENGRSESLTYENGRSESPSKVGQSDLPRSVRESVEESPLRDFSKRRRKDSSSSSFSDFEKTIANVCGIKLGGASKNKIQQVQKAAKALADDNVKAEQVTAFGAWWDRVTPPRPSQICDEWGQFEADIQSEVEVPANGVSFATDLLPDANAESPLAPNDPNNPAALWATLAQAIVRNMGQSDIFNTPLHGGTATLSEDKTLTVTLIKPSAAKMMARWAGAVASAVASVAADVTVEFVQAELVAK